MHFAHGRCLRQALILCSLSQWAQGWSSGLLSYSLKVCSALAGELMNRAAYRPLRKRKASGAVQLIASIALMTFFNSQLILAVCGLMSRPSLSRIRCMTLGARITFMQVTIIAVSVVLLNLAVADEEDQTRQSHASCL